MSDFTVEYLNLKERPSGRNGFGICNANNIIYIFGGFSHEKCDDLWYLSSNQNHMLFYTILNAYILYCILHGQYTHT